MDVSHTIPHVARAYGPRFSAGQQVMHRQIPASFQRSLPLHSGHGGSVSPPIPLPLSQGIYPLLRYHPVLMQVLGHFHPLPKFECDPLLRYRQVLMRG